MTIPTTRASFSSLVVGFVLQVFPEPNTPDDFDNGGPIPFLDVESVLQVSSESNSPDDPDGTEGRRGWNRDHHPGGQKKRASEEALRSLVGDTRFELVTPSV